MMQHLAWNEATPGRDRGRMRHFQTFSPESSPPQGIKFEENQ